MGAANIPEREGAKQLLGNVQAERSRWPRRVRIWVDGGFSGKDFLHGVMDTFRLILDIVLRPEGAQGFVVLPKRWTVERTFGWLNRYRRLSKDYEVYTDHSEGMIYGALRRLMLVV